jgi:hypothetical protein
MTTISDDELFKFADRAAGRAVVITGRLKAFDYAKSIEINLGQL